jgi:hypothetical protein
LHFLVIKLAQFLGGKKMAEQELLLRDIIDCIERITVSLYKRGNIAQEFDIIISKLDSLKSRLGGNE